MHQLYVLYENASGYALFRTTEYEEVAMLLPQVRKSMMDVSKFRSIVHLIAFHPFKNGEEALANMKCIAEGKLHRDLQLFLENNVPKFKNKAKQSPVLGIQEAELAREVTETLGITCSTSGPVIEIIRGIRHHFHKLIKGYKDVNTIIKSQQGLAHHYSRAKMCLNIYKFDNMITHSVSALDQLDKDINTLSLRVREWFSFHFPELIKIVPQIELYIKCVKEIKDRNNMPENVEENLQVILQDSESVQKILEASHNSMGMEIATEDVENIERFVEQIYSLIKRRDEMNNYLISKMNQIAPNLAAVAGEMVGARLISQAGSLTNLSKFPASTVQILGAEKSLFRILKSKSKKTVAFNSLSHDTCIGRAGKVAKGRMSRFLANKCTLASRIDCFSKIPINKHGLELKQQVEDRMKFYETGKFASNANPAITEERKKVLAAKRALLRKKKRDRKHKKVLKGNESSTEFQEKTVVKDMTEKLEEIFLTDSLKELEYKGKERRDRKSQELSTEDEMKDTGIEIGGANGAHENVAQEQPDFKKKRKSLRIVAQTKVTEQKKTNDLQENALNEILSPKRKSLRY